MSDDPNTPENAEWKKFTRFLVHVLYFILALILFVATITYLSEFNVGSIFLLYYGVIISIFLVIIEIIYFLRLRKPCKTPHFVKRYLGFLTSVVGRGMFYQLLGLHYLMMDHQYRWGGNNIQLLSIFFGWLVWLVGLCLMAFAILAKAYNFLDWIEDEEEEGERRLELDEEGDMNVGLLGDEVV
jgi:hypothetical protein